MKQCNNKIKHTCSEKNYATCIYYEGELSNSSELNETDCLDIQEVVEDINVQIDNLYENSELSELGNSCLTFADKKVKTVLLKMEEEICLLKERVLELETTALCNMDISCLDVSGLTDACDAPIQNLGQLLTYLINN